MGDGGAFLLVRALLVPHAEEEVGFFRTGCSSSDMTITSLLGGFSMLETVGFLGLGGKFLRDARVSIQTKYLW
jgi:hypothetical protein